MVDEPPGPTSDIALVRWPEQETTRSTLRSAGRPRLLLLGPDTPAPEPGDDLEDWVRIPLGEADLAARLRWLADRVTRSQGGKAATAVTPQLDDDGLISVGDEWASLPPVEHRLARALLDRMGAVVSREALAQAGWPHGAPGRNALDVHVLRLRRRLAPLDLGIHTVRSRGYLLVPSRPGAARRSG